MRTRTRTFITHILLACLGPGFVTPGLANDIESVLIVSIDALHPAALGEKTSPTLYALMQAGQFTLNGRSVNPPKTLIAHTAMITGRSPARNGKRDNEWIPGEARVSQLTLFDDARRRGFRTAFYFAKPRLGYLVSNAVDEHALAPHDGIERVREFFHAEGRRLAFLHISGLDFVGPESGWLSPDYLDELTEIDAALAPLINDVRQRGFHAIVVTSDHAGHQKLHGTGHPEDYRLPLILLSNADHLPRSLPQPWPVTNLRGLVRSLLPRRQLQSSGIPSQKESPSPLRRTAAPTALAGD